MKVLALIIALALLVTPLTVAAPPPGTVHRIGFLWNASPALTHHLLEAFRHGLHERGYVEGTHFTIEPLCRGDPARLPGLAAELVGLQVAVIVTAGSQAIQAVKQATSTIPVVIAASSDPVETGFVTSLARPGENLTGLSLSAPELSGKRLELLKEAVPAITHVAVLVNPANPNTTAQLRETSAQPRRCRCSCTRWRCAARRSWTRPSPPSAVCRRTRSSCSWIRCLCNSVRVWSS